MPTIEISEETLEKIKEQFLNEIAFDEVNSYEDLIGKKYLFWCVRYHFFGEVTAVNQKFITLKNAQVIFESGEYENKKPSDGQKLPKGINIPIQSIEAFCQMNWE
jgi:hypothetical protein